MANPAPFVSFLKKIIPEVEKVEKQRKDANLNQRVLDYIKDLEHSSLFETDFITGFVIDSLERLANKEGQKKLKVLVIDDLDRIDPEHIFRLFNIFSSYQNYRKSAYNKFGFDKVVFVCDIENIRNVFSTRYGASVDFSGYIDKFYSTNVFYFDNSSAVTTFTDKIVSSLKFDENSTYAAAFLKSLEHADNALLRFFIKVGIDSGALSLRKIKSILTRTYSIKEHILPFYHKRGISNLNLPAVVSLEVMIHYFGGVIHLKRALQRMGNYKKSRHTNIMNHSQSGNDLNIIGYFIPVLDYEQHNFDLDQEDSSREPFEYDLKGQKIVYRLSNLSPLSNIYHGRISRESDTNYSFAVIDIIQVTLDHLVDVGYFKAD